MHAIPSLSAASNVSVVTIAEAVLSEEESREKTPLKKSNKGSRSRKRKSATQVMPEGVELTSPEKIMKANQLDDEIETLFR